MEQKVAVLMQWIEESDNIVFFGGAGVSTESNIPDFRGPHGLYNQNHEYPHPPEVMLSASFFYAHPADFFRYHFDKLVYADAKPNAAHHALARLEKTGKLKAIITQNVDGLHQMAGSENVLELHGSAQRNYCLNCGLKYSFSYVLEQSPGVPHCLDCGGIVRPDVVLYEEALPQAVLAAAEKAINKADTMIVGGTSLVVYPAAGLIKMFRGRHLVIINIEPTDYDKQADLILRDPIGKVLGAAISD
ncbi:MAG: NAD-dependent protein deacylase [Clostridiales bacterium]|nr:NAD-dependent protein deacylase [Clostridiales bacterium]